MKRRNLSNWITITLIIYFVFGCETPNRQCEIELPFKGYSMEDNAVQKEMDEIYALLAYSLVFKDWQSDTIPRDKRRGYNIGTILVDNDKNIASWGLNCVNATDNSTQHGEVRAITSYLDSLRSFNLKGFTLYTTLEPCAMCSGMATMTSLERVVYGQKDVEFSGALDRLALNSEKFGGFRPYPRTVISDPAPTEYRQQLDAAFKNFLANEDEKYLAKFLTSNKAEQMYSRAFNDFLEYDVKYPSNQEYFEKAKLFLERITFNALKTL